MRTEGHTKIGFGSIASVTPREIQSRSLFVLLPSSMRTSTSVYRRKQKSELFRDFHSSQFPRHFAGMPAPIMPSNKGIGSVGATREISESKQDCTQFVKTIFELPGV
jgi:hypothetical protein